MVNQSSFFYLFNLFIALFFYKLLGLLGFNTFILIYGFNLSLRLFLSVVLFVVLSYYSKIALPLILNNIFFQIFFFIFLGVENLLLGLPFWATLFVVFLFFMDLSYYSYSCDPLTWEYTMLSALLVITTYNQLRRLLVNPEVDGSDLKLENENDLTWERIIQNMSAISLKFYGKPIRNRIQANDTFPYIAKRYMTFGKLRVLGQAASSSAGNFFRGFWEACKSHPSGVVAATGVVGLAGTGVGMGVKELGPQAKAEAELKLAEAEFKTQQARHLRIENDQYEKKIVLETDITRLQKEIDEERTKLELLKGQVKVIKPDTDPATSLSCSLEDGFTSFFYFLKNLIM